MNGRGSQKVIEPNHARKGRWLNFWAYTGGGAERGSRKDNVFAIWLGFSKITVAAALGVNILHHIRVHVPEVTVGRFETRFVESTLSLRIIRKLGMEKKKNGPAWMTKDGGFAPARTLRRGYGISTNHRYEKSHGWMGIETLQSIGVGEEEVTGNDQVSAPRNA